MARDEVSEEWLIGRVKAMGCQRKSLRVGEIILIIDADIILPEDCFRDAALEMYAFPDLAIIQTRIRCHASRPQPTSRTVSLTSPKITASTSVSPTFLRWSAMQDVSFIEEDDGAKEEDGKRKIRSEANVSAD